MFQGMFFGTKEQTDDFEQRFAEELCQRFSGVRCSLSFMKQYRLERQRLLLFQG